jgi:hypothetical protein
MKFCQALKFCPDESKFCLAELKFCPAEQMLCSGEQKFRADILLS